MNYVKDESPRDKILCKGASALSDVELLRSIIGGGTKGCDVRQIAKNLNSVIRKVGLEELTADDLKSVKGIGDARAALVFAVLEFGKRQFTKQVAPLIDSPEKAAEQLQFICEKKQEYFAMLTLNGARRLISKHTITVGTLSSSLVHPREIFALAIEERAASIIIGHNHPSGMLDISEQDRNVSQRIKLAGEIIGINLDDHIIVVRDGFVSAM